MRNQGVLCPKSFSVRNRSRGSPRGFQIGGVFAQEIARCFGRNFLDIGVRGQDRDVKASARAPLTSRHLVLDNPHRRSCTVEGGRKGLENCLRAGSQTTRRAWLKLPPVTGAVDLI